VAAHVLQLFLEYFIQESGFSLSTSSVLILEFGDSEDLATVFHLKMKLAIVPPI